MPADHHSEREQEQTEAVEARLNSHSRQTRANAASQTNGSGRTCHGPNIKPALRRLPELIPSSVASGSLSNRSQQAVALRLISHRDDNALFFDSTIQQPREKLCAQPKPNWGMARKKAFQAEHNSSRPRENHQTHPCHDVQLSRRHPSEVH
jgi:hypothetical protein